MTNANIKINIDNSGIMSQLASISIQASSFGTKGDGIQDDSIGLIAAVAYAKMVKKPLKLSGKHYVTQTIDFSDLIKVIGTGCDSVSLGYDTRMYGGSVVGTKWFTDARPPYSFFVDGLYGDCIISDVANPIVKCETGNLDVDGWGIYGWYGCANQVGFMDSIASPTGYNGSIRHFTNFKVVYCGGHGIHLKRGLENANWENTHVFMNGGYGLFVENLVSVNPLDYSKFTNCTFENNFYDGVYLKGFHKNIEFDACNLSRNGQYQLASQTGKDRSYPSNFGNIKVGVRVETYNGINGQNLILKNCYGEQCQAMAHVVASSGVFNNIVINSCSQMPLQDTPEQLALTSAMMMTSGNWIQHIDFKNNIVSNNVIGIYNVNATALGNIIMSGGLQTTSNIVDSVFTSVIKQTYGSHPARTETFDISGYFTGSGQLKGIPPLVLLINSNWQANNSIGHGSYMLTIQKGFNGQYRMATLAFSSVDGFTAPPTLDATTGMLSIFMADAMEYTITRLDMNGTIKLS